jgi:hypothetical protein
MEKQNTKKIHNPEIIKDFWRDSQYRALEGNGVDNSTTDMSMVDPRKSNKSFDGRERPANFTKLNGGSFFYSQP